VKFAENGLGREAEVFAPPDQPSERAYFRYAKLWLGVGDKSGQDHAYGQFTSGSRVDNPYVPTFGTARSISTALKWPSKTPINRFRCLRGILQSESRERTLAYGDGMRGALLALSRLNCWRELLINSVKLLPFKSYENYRTGLALLGRRSLFATVTGIFSWGAPVWINYKTWNFQRQLLHFLFFKDRSGLVCGVGLLSGAGFEPARKRASV